MGLDFDLRNFIEDMKACKPPYKCPFCGRVYKTFSGIHVHIGSHEMNNSSGGGGCAGGAGTGNSSTNPSRPPSPFYKSPLKDTLTYIEGEKTLEFEAEGRLHKFSVFEKLDIMSRDVWEASLPPQAFEKDPPEKRPVEPPPKPPATAKKGKKKGNGSGGISSDMPNNGGGGGGDPESSRMDDSNASKILKLPEASFREINDYDIGPAQKMTDSYYRFIEKPAQELDEEVEYDMDEEDVAWLNIINDKRVADNLAKVTEDQFELLMDRLEKESYFHVQSNGTKDIVGSSQQQPIDDDAICCVCMDGECSNTNVILFCDLCNLAVHQECYGVPYIPEGQWLCRRCLQSPSRSVECCLCPNRGGAFKQTDDGRWAHVVCGLWIPEVRFANTVFLEPIDSIDNIPPARWKLSCRVCKQRGVGACIQCHKTNCYTAFHVTCGLLAGLHMKMDTVRESSATGLSVTVRKTAYCDVHTPHDSDCKPRLDDVAALGISTPKQKSKSPKKSANSDISPPLPVLFRGLMNFSPQCPWEKVQEIASLISVQRKNQFFQRLMAYWTLKRQTRNGVPLIRRLQFAKATRSDKSPETPQKNAHHNKKKKEREKAVAKKAKDEFKAMLEQRRLLRRLRQDLERVRLLCELIRKREQRKRELIIIDESKLELELMPFIYFLRKLMDMLQEIDTSEIFGEPVSLEEVPDYLDHIKHPMDFQTMREKLSTFQYLSIDNLEKDFTLMVENCLSYNEKDTIFYRAGVKMRDQGGSIIRQARRQLEAIGFDLETWLHSTNHPTSPKAELSDEKIMKEIDEFINKEVNDDEEHLKKLLELHDRATFIHHPVAKNKRLKLLKQEITKMRRKLSMDKAGTSPGFKAKSSSYSSDQPRQIEEPVSMSTKKSKNDGIPSRRLRTEVNSKPRGRKRQREASEPAIPTVTTGSSNGGPEKRAKLDFEGGVKNQVTTSPTKTGGVNRRNAVLFTRKKQANMTPTGEEKVTTKKKINDNEESNNKSSLSPPKTGKSSKTKPLLRSKSPSKATKKCKEPIEPGLEAMETEVQSPQPQSSLKESSPCSPKVEKKKRGRKPKALITSETAPETPKTTASATDVIVSSKQSSPPGAAVAQMSPLKKEVISTSASFQEYRRGGVGGDSTDEDTRSESATDMIGTSEDDSEESDSDSDSSTAATSAESNRMPLEPLDLIWAKTRGYPWYPALIINPKMPRTGYLHNGVPIPVPPQDVLDMANTHSTPHYLILFFDAKRTWQWLQRDKLEPLGVDSELDKAKLVQSKKPSERKAVKKAYEDAILHRCKVTGENTAISGEDSSADEEHKITL